MAPVAKVPRSSLSLFYVSTTPAAIVFAGVRSALHDAARTPSENTGPKNTFMCLLSTLASILDVVI
jgi:hypothetical protein